MTNGIPRSPGACPACGAAGSGDPLFLQDEYATYACGSCGTCFVPHDADEASLYARENFTADEERRALADPAFRRYAAAHLRRLREATNAGDPAGRPRRLLDVGCNTGRFLVLAREHGWDVAGADLNEAQVRFARETHSLDARAAFLHEAGFEEDSFDAVTLMHVVEHLRDPVALLRDCARLLRPGGVLLVDTPNVASWSAKLYGPGWMWYAPPDHVTLFTPRGLEAALGRAGLEVERIRTQDSLHRSGVFLWASTLKAATSRTPRPPLPANWELAGPAATDEPRGLKELLDRRIGPRMLAPAAKLAGRTGRGSELVALARRADA